MALPAPPKPRACGADCQACPQVEEARWSAAAPQGFRFVVAAAVVFLLPLATGFLGALLGGAGAGQLAGGAAGLFAGMILAWGLGRLTRRPVPAAGPEHPEERE